VLGFALELLMHLNWTAYEEELEKQAAGIHMPGLTGVIDPKATIAKPMSASVRNPMRAGAQGMGWMRNIKRIPRI